MTNQERIEKYKKENCENCKNRKENLCDIRIFNFNEVITTRCLNYEKQVNLKECMKRRCEQCKHYDYCFEYRSKKEKIKNEIQNKQYKVVNRRSR